MVEPEEAGQPAVVLLALLQVVDEVDLPLHQRLGAPGEVDEHRVDVAAQLGLVGRQPDGLAVDLVEGPRHLTDLVAGVDADGGHLDGRGVLAGLAQHADGLGQPGAGDLQRLAAQPPQRADQRAGHHQAVISRTTSSRTRISAPEMHGVALLGPLQLLGAGDDGVGRGRCSTVRMPFTIAVAESYQWRDLVAAEVVEVTDAASLAQPGDDQGAQASARSICWPLHRVR